MPDIQNGGSLAAAERQQATMATAEKRPKTVAELLTEDAFKASVAAALPRFFDSDRFIRSAFAEFRGNPALKECTVPSVMGFFMQAALCGLEPSSVLGQCYPVAFNNKKTGQRECQFIMGYRGMASIARRGGEVISIDSHIVYEKDEFTIEYGIDSKLIHKPNFSEDHGDMIGAYCVVKFRDGSYQFLYMPKWEIERHRKRSKSATYGPWVTDYDEMAKKTVFRAMFKWLPISIEQAQLADRDASVANFVPPEKAGANIVLEDIPYTVAQDEEAGESDE